MAEIAIQPPEVNQLLVTEGERTVAVQSVTNKLTTVIARGPQGPAGAGGLIVNTDAKVDKSIVYYNSFSGEFKADATWTTSTLTDGGNF
jgi:hypothetical protein